MSWLQENNLTTLVGVVFYYDTYLNGIQFQGSKQTDEDKACQGIQYTRYSF